MLLVADTLDTTHHDEFDRPTFALGECEPVDHLRKHDTEENHVGTPSNCQLKTRITRWKMVAHPRIMTPRWPIKFEDRVCSSFCATSASCSEVAMAYRSVVENFAGE
jgi:hypothetical protein